MCPSEERLIFHVDMDAFFAAVEQRDHPEWRGKPVIVGGISKRGVVATASYEARAFGIHSAMPATTAHALCPQGIFVRGRFERYRYFSAQVFDILAKYTSIIQQVSIDEGYLDMTGKAIDPYQKARQIQREVYEKTGLTLSVGISFNKFLAKIASDWQKPQGVFWIKKENFSDLLGPLPIRKVHGIGKKTEEKLHEIGIHTICQLQKQSLSFLREYLGAVFGQTIYERIRGIDERPVKEEAKRKSYGKETTFLTDTKDFNQIETHLLAYAEKISHYLKGRNKKAYTLCLKIKYEDFESHTRSKTLAKATDDAEILFKEASKLLRTGLDKKIRLVGLSVSGMESILEEQISLWEYLDEHKKSK